ncbi:MAG TPA: pyridoxamine 5'-phosphate oxidase [Nocardioides sp.]|uniref:pyridoxamine 5'-phosphate oxidase n=1 Tax=Nocardioides sp. TaxID=35761 RepID=UPI002D7FD9D8|nr:pyridoxamine 5'-phosphate oxidase [Nocardioides sp.]HET6651488.1 pyridoxamine 5'-phosphate oxidase [Nocardioides sp.]
MSVKVDLDELARHVAAYGFAYLVTVTDDHRTHVVAVRPTMEADGLRVEGLGARTRANVGVRPDVTLVWPPVTDGGYTLIVDGRARPDDDGAAVTPTHAVLHRPAADAPEGQPSDATSCGADCVPVADA